MTVCVALLGGSFDPVHHGHVALAALFATLLAPDQLRLIPAGQPWQKGSLRASAADRVAMLELAFADAALPVTIDRQEIDRASPSYTVETLRNVRAELGPDAAIVFLLGADQLRQLDTWRDWQALFDLAHLGIAARPGFGLDQAGMAPALAHEITTRQGNLAQLRTTSAGKVFLAPSLAVDISATQIRAALQRGEQPTPLIAPVVLDYIQQHNLYKI
ncbi:MAG: nicotinate-nucleotide adenylyltransferase [Massilia sp.]